MPLRLRPPGLGDKCDSYELANSQSPMAQPDSGMRLREPFNGASHLIGLLLACAGTWLLLRSAYGPWETAAFIIYGGTLILLYGISSLYHSLPVAGRPLKA